MISSLDIAEVASIEPNHRRMGNRRNIAWVGGSYSHSQSKTNVCVGALSEEKAISAPFRTKPRYSALIRTIPHYIFF
jgi:hypothetical protein